MKYIIFESNGLECPILFPEYVKHDEIANKFRSNKILSAGRVSLVSVDAGGACFSGSVSLGIKSSPAQTKEDTEILQKTFDFCM